MKKVIFLTVLTIIFSLLLSGCGYRLASMVNPMLDNYDSIAIPYFENKTFEAEAVTIFTYAVVNEFVESKRLKVENIDKADLVLYGKIIKLDERSIGYSGEDKAREYRIWGTLELSLEEKSTGKVLWKRNQLTHDNEYLSADLRAGGEITETDASKRKALVLLAEDLAERIHDSIIQGF
jgi:hypothetical protein